ncbi:condensin complex subunit 3-like [Oncorhynchus masou masou]|uniref:condensin complex subunit 3-like n=1 Tax=Oncorhynchus masou masou TaxID=90313 RepID=UPI003182D63B
MTNVSRREKMTGESDLSIKEAFQRAQKGHNNKAKLVASLKNTYNKSEDKTLFHEEFIQYLKHAMIVYKREPAVENVIEFVSKFSTTQNPFLSYMFNFLLESHKASSQVPQGLVKVLIYFSAANPVSPFSPTANSHSVFLCVS